MPNENLFDVGKRVGHENTISCVQLQLFSAPLFVITKNAASAKGPAASGIDNALFYEMQNAVSRLLGCIVR